MKRMKKSLLYEITGFLLALVGAFMLVWPLRSGADIRVILFALFIIAVAWRFNVKAQKLKAEGILKD